MKEEFPRICAERCAKRLDRFHEIVKELVDTCKERPDQRMALDSLAKRIFEYIKSNETLFNYAKNLQHSSNIRLDKMRVDDNLYQSQIEDMDNLIKQIRRREITFVDRKKPDVPKIPEEENTSTDSTEPLTEKTDTPPDSLS